MARWLVTGASGFLGANAGHFLAGRAERIGLARSGPPEGLFDDVVSVDLLDSAAVTAAVCSARPDVVLHAAALADHERCEAEPTLAYEVNALAAGTIAEAAASVGAAFVQISTDSVFDGLAGGYREVDDPAPFSEYGRTKLDGERLVMDAHPGALVVRTNFFGWSPSGSRSILEFFVRAAESQTPVTGYTDFTVTSIYAQALLETIWELVGAVRMGVIHVASRDPLTKFEFGAQAVSAFGGDPVLVVPGQAPPSDDATSRRRNLSLNTDLLTSWLGHRPPTQADGIDAAFRDRPLRDQVRGLPPTDGRFDAQGV